MLHIFFGCQVVEFDDKFEFQSYARKGAVEHSDLLFSIAPKLCRDVVVVLWRSRCNCILGDAQHVMYSIEGASHGDIFSIFFLI